MEGEGFLSSRENPRFAPSLPPAPAPEFSQRASPPILERFRAAIRDREDALRAGGEEDPLPPPTTEEVVGLYEELLAELTFNSKPIITELTMIAGEQREHGAGIADAICNRIMEVSADQKLPSLYLLDSIVKNIGHEYVRFFSAGLPKVFGETYNQVSQSLRPAMRHLFGTWSQVFPSKILGAVDNALQFPASQSLQLVNAASVRSSLSPTSRPSRVIHINPKYLEEHGHSDNSVVDVHETRGMSSNLHVINNKSSGRVGQYDYVHSDMIHPQLRIQRGVSPPALTGHSPVLETGQNPSIKSKVSRISSPPRPIWSRSPSNERFNSETPIILAEGASPSKPTYGLGHKKSEHSGWLGLDRHSDDGAQGLEHASTFDPKKQHPRELIDAYGNYRGKSSFNDSLPKVRVDVNGINNEASVRNWQNSDEEEYVWENMSPTLADASRGNNVAPFGSGIGSINANSDISRRLSDTYTDSDFRRSSWPIHPLAPRVDDPAIRFEDRFSKINPRHGSLNNRFIEDEINRTEPIDLHRSTSHRGQDPWKLPYVVSRPLGQKHFPKLREQIPHIPAASRISSVIGQKRPSQSDYEYSVAERSQVSASSIWLPADKLLPEPSHVRYPYQKFDNHFDFINGARPTTSRGHSQPVLLPLHRNDVADGNTQSLDNLLHLPHQSSVSVLQNMKSEQQGDAHPNHFLGNHGMLPLSESVQPHLVNQPAHRSQALGKSVVLGSVLATTLPEVTSSQENYKLSDPFLHVHGVPLPPLPPGRPPALLQVGPSVIKSSSVASSSTASPFSGLLSSLMNKGLISLGPSAASQDSVGVEFHPELLKVRHEAAIIALYSDLPRQCTTCGLRFKCQEEHRGHMDWHVTKNRISKNRKQKPSRKWFVSIKEWLSGAETLGADFVPGFLPPETVTEKQEDKEVAVPADDNQNVCVLCGEPFEDFYSDETEEWMFKGAVYLNAPNGYIDLDRSQLGPIIHANCRSESTG